MSLADHYDSYDFIYYKINLYIIQLTSQKKRKCYLNSEFMANKPCKKFYHRSFILLLELGWKHFSNI